MNKKSIGAFCIALICLAAGAACHGLRTSGNPLKFKIGVAAGVAMIIAAAVFAIAGVVLMIKKKNVEFM